MILWWVWNLVLLAVVAPVVVYLLHGVLQATKSIEPEIQAIQQVAAAASTDLDAVRLLDTTQGHVGRTIAAVESYGRSLDILLDDA